MVENDIYNSKSKYENFKRDLDNFLIKPDHRPMVSGNSKFYCKNPVNLQYFKALFDKFEARDLSFVRRNRLIADMRLITHVISKDLSECEREDIDGIMRFINDLFSTRCKADFVLDIKYIWKILFPEKDEKGRIDDILVPYAVRHLKRRIDKSTEKLRKDRVSLEDFEKLVNYFNNDPKMQLFLTLAFESLSRPQELLYTKIEDIELHDNYAKIWISEHGKEGIKFLTCIDSYPYLIRWLDEHPFKKEKKCYLFIKYNKSKNQLTPKNINERIRTALNCLEIDKPVTCYSIKRNGVTCKRLRGCSDVEIQHMAGWTSTKMLKNYDLSEQEDTLKLQLIKKGLIKDKENKYPELKIEAKTCLYCGFNNKFTDEFCFNCKRLLDRDKLIEEEKKRAKADKVMDLLLQNEIFKEFFIKSLEELNNCSTPPK